MPKLDPNNIEAFMTEYVVKTPTALNGPIPYTDSNKKLVWAKLSEADPPSRLAGSAGGIFVLNFVTAEEKNDDAFLIYWVEYMADGDGVATWLGRDSPLMFTALMTGCTFGLGSATAHGVMAAHVNSMSKSKTGMPDKDQIKDQHKKLKKLNLKKWEISPKIYLGSIGKKFDTQLKTTPFGFRSGRGSEKWNFCWQKYKQVGAEHHHMGVARHAVI
jgi:hypothetical protein